MDIKDQVKRAVSIVDVCSLYVQLKPAGKHFKALCPFHQEKTPSFYVMPEKETFTCYGCHAYGDIFSMIQQQEGLSFPEAQRFIIERFHLPLNSHTKQIEPKEQYERINEAALHFFKQQLWDSDAGQEARLYLSKRGISEQTLKDYSIGLAQNRWDGLLTYLQSKGFTSKQGIEMGLLASSESDKCYDRFRNRVIIPIFSINDKLIAFGGRALDDQPAKYINSPETPLYKKGQHLFGFNLARQPIRKAQSLILVEGYFDQIALYQKGIQNVVASLGTALTDEQAYLIKRFTEQVYVCYDNDAPGQKAALSVVEKLLAFQVSSRVVTLSFGKDPDEMIRSQGTTAFEKELAGSLEGFRFLLNRLQENHDLKDPSAKSRAIQSLAPIIHKAEDPVVRNDLMRKCEDFFNVPLGDIKQLLAGPQIKSNDLASISPVPTAAEVDFLQTLLTSPLHLSQLEPLLSDDLLQILTIGSILRVLKKIVSQNQETSLDAVSISSMLISHLNGSDRPLAQGIINQLPHHPHKPDNPGEVLEQCMLNFYQNLNKKQIEQLNRRIHMAEQNGDTVEVRTLMDQKNQFIKKIRNKKQIVPSSTDRIDRRP